MTGQEVLQTLKEVGALSSGHFILSSGRHSDTYAEKFRALERPTVARAFGAALADRFRDRAIDVVLSPAVGAIILGFATAMALSARFVFAEREAGAMVLRRGFEISPGERSLVVEDIVTTGGSLREVLRLVPPGKLVGIGCLVDRSGGIELPMPLESLARLDAPSWSKEECRLCREGVAATTPGGRRLTP